MRRQRARQGFTIIEVVLFLAITGLMMVGVLVGVGGSINRQRYQDAVATVQDFFQGQYNTVDNVYTNRPASLRCNAGGIGVSGGVGQARGTSNCSIVGRYLTSGDGVEFTSEPVFALNDVTAVDASSFSSELDYITALNLVRAGASFEDDNERFVVPWGTHIYTDKDQKDSSQSLTMLLVKMPTSGLIRTFTVFDDDKSVADTISGATASTVAICVAPDGLVSSPPSGVNILPLAANVSGVQPIVGSEGGC